MASPVDVRMFVEALPTPALVLDLDEVVVAANAPAVATFAQKNATAVGKKFKDALDDGWRPALTRAIGEMKHERRAQLVCVSAESGKANSRASDVRVQPIHGDNGSLRGVLVIVADDHREADRLWSAKLETANAELHAANEELEARLEELRVAHRSHDERNRFLAMLAHELRNPLAAITQALYLLRRRHITHGDRLAEQALRVAERQSQNQARLLNDLLDVSRVVLGKIVLRVEPTDLVAIVRQAIEAAEFSMRSRAHSLRTDVPDHPVRVMGDPVRLEQVVANLLSNAVKYTPPGGEIALTITATSETATLSLSDTGAGIERELLDHIFDLFTQGDATRARSREMRPGRARRAVSVSA